MWRWTGHRLRQTYDWWNEEIQQWRGRGCLQTWRIDIFKLVTWFNWTRKKPNRELWKQTKDTIWFLKLFSPLCYRNKLVFVFIYYLRNVTFVWSSSLKSPHRTSFVTVRTVARTDVNEYNLLWGYYITQLAGSRRDPKLDGYMTYHKWRILKSWSRDGVISQHAVFVYLTFLIDEIGFTNCIIVYYPISSIKNVK